MSFEEFVTQVKENILSYLPEEYAGAKVQTSTTNRVNGESTSLTVVPEGIADSIVPTIRLEGMYQRINDGDKMSEVMEMLSKTILQAYSELDRMEPKENIVESFSDKNIFLQLINTESNKEMLNNMPHRQFNDMSVIYRVLVKKDEDGMQSVMINDELAAQMGLSEEELFEKASVQTKKIFEPKIQKMSEVLAGFMGVDEDMLEELEMDTPALYIVSNDMSVNGASLMVYDDILQEVSNKVGENIYILPSSIHEFLAAPESLCDAEELGKMVFEINQSSVDERDRLSNQVFHYDAKSRELTQVTDVPVLGIRNIDFSRNTAYQQKVAAPTVAMALT